MFSKVFVAWKRNYGEQIVLRACSMLREAGVTYVFNEPKGCDLAIMVGGDGTLLKFQSSLECPIIGINPGKSVGHYMTANYKDFEGKIRKLLEGREGCGYFIREFTRLEAAINRTPIPFHALNEFLISPVYTRRIFNADMAIKGKKSKERNSGILVYTPSGSSAYAKSAGAKPLKANSVFGVAAIAPYLGRLAKGEIILEKGNVVIESLKNDCEVCTDGQEDQICRLAQGDKVTVKRSAKPAKIIIFSKKKS